MSEHDRRSNRPTDPPIPTADRDADAAASRSPGKMAEFVNRRARSLMGPIKTAAPWGSFGTDWAQINRWDPDIRVAAAEFGVPAERIKAHIVIESQGNPDAIQHNNTNGWSYGLMQVVPYGVGWAGWHRDVFRLAGVAGGNADQMLLAQPALNIRVGTFILTVQHANHQDWDKASSAFFLGNPNWIGADGVNGTQGIQYRQTLHGLIAEQTAEQPHLAFEPGDRIRVIDGDPPLNLRPSPGTGRPPLRTLSTGVDLCVVDGPVPADGHEWYAVDLATGEHGWVAGQFCGLTAKHGCRPV